MAHSPHFLDGGAVWSEQLLQQIRNNDTTLQNLTISFNKIGEERARYLAEALKINTSLQCLSLSKNQIGAGGAQHLSDSLKINTSLQSLDISSNDIGAEGARHLADVLKISASLQHLDISWNNIGDEGARSLADALKISASLQHLNIAHNNIGAEGTRHLADSLKINASLQHLDISWNNIGNEGARHLASVLKLNTLLQHLDILDQMDWKEGAQFLADALNVNTSVKRLNISSNSIGDEGARQLADALKTNTSLQNLNLSENIIGDEGARDLTDALKINTSLRRLNISRNQIGEEGARHLADALKINTSLQRLGILNNKFHHRNSSISNLIEKNNILKNIQNNSDSLTRLSLKGFDIGVEGTRDFSDALKINTSLQHLIISENNIGAEGARHLALAIQINSSLRDLETSKNEIGDEGARHLAAALKINTSLQHLNISQNNIRKEGARYLAEAIQINTSLQHLDISNNKIGEKGARHLADVLKINTSLQHLIISENHIGEEGARHLADALKINISLQHLKFSHNKIGKEGARYLADAIKINISLKHLDIPNNHIGAEGAHHLADSLKFNTSLQHLDTSSNKIEDEGARHLADSLKINTSLQHLDISFNNIGDENILFLADALKINLSLQFLDLSDNAIGDEGARQLAESLKINTSLQNLNISFNKIGDEGARYFADALKFNISLQQFKCLFNNIQEEQNSLISTTIERNLILRKIKANKSSLRNLSCRDFKLGDEGARHLADALKINTSLQSLNISSNSIGEEGARHLADALKINTSLQHLNFTSNSIGDEGARHLADVLKINTSLQHLNISQNSIGNEGARHLTNSLKTNTSLQHLDISLNVVTLLSDSIEFPPNLTALDISHNRLQSLPLSFASLIEKLGDRFNFEGNPLSDIPENYRQSNDRLVKYLRETHKANVRRIKIMLVGEPAAGKTTFLKRLQGQISFLGKLTGRNTKRVSTDGVDIVELEAESGSMSFVVMDFAGQELYHVTHEFFLSASNSIFVGFFDLKDEWKRSRIVVEANQPQSPSTLDRLEFWWNSIHARAPRAHMCIVGSKVDCVPERDRSQLLKSCSDRLMFQFKQFQSYHNDDSTLQFLNPPNSSEEGHCFWPLSSINNIGVQTFLEFLTDNARTIVRSQKVPYRAILLHRHICEIRSNPQSRIDPPLVLITQFLKDHANHIYQPDELDQLEAASDLLREWGTILRFKEESGGDLSKWIILDPQWLAEMFRSLIVSEKLKTSEQAKEKTVIQLEEGHVDRITLRNRADKLKMREDTLKFVVKLFKMLQVAVDDPNSPSPMNPQPQGGGEDFIPNRFVIPGLLKEEDKGAIEQHNKLVNFHCMERRYGIEFVPHGMVGRLISEIVSDLDELLGDRKTVPRTVKMWRKGIIINTQISHVFELSALVELDPIENVSSQSGSLILNPHKNRFFTDKLIPSTRRCIRLSVRAELPTQMGRTDEMKKNDEERCRRMMRWLHSKLISIISDSYPGLKKKTNDENSESAASLIVPIIIHCPICTARQQQSTPTTRIGAFDYAACWSFLSQQSGEKNKSKSRSKIQCEICKQQKIEIELKKRNLIPEFHVLSLSTSTTISDEDKRVKEEIEKLIITSQSNNEEESKEACHKLWPLMKVSQQDNNWLMLNHIVREIRRHEFDSSVHELGEGGFARVVMARIGKQDMAMKMMKFSQNPTEMNSVHRIQLELMIMW